MRVVRAAGILMAVWLSSGCLVTTLQPPFDDQSITFEPSLVGRWVREEDAVTVVIERGEWRSYAIAYTDRFGTYQYTGYLTTIGKTRLLAVRPENGLERQAFLLVTHGILKIEPGSERVDVAELDYDAALKRAQGGGNAFGIPATLDVRQNIVISADTKRLRAWLGAHVDSPGWWGEWKRFTREAPKQPGATPE